MIKHYYKERRKVRTILLLFIVSFLTIHLSSCYLYEGPTRKKPQKPEIKLPPPEPKVYAEPVSKKEYINKAYNELKDVLEDAEVKLVEDSIKVLFPNNIVYDNRSTLPSSNYKDPLDRFTYLLKKYRKTNILITGHTDNHGDPKFNMALSKERANAIKTYLQFNGIGIGRLKSWGLGPKYPIDTNDTPEGRAKNRRVEFVVLYRDRQQ